MGTILVKADESTATRRRVRFDCRDATDNFTPETGEGGGQPQISINGAAFSDTGIGTLTHSGNGRYYADLTQAVCVAGSTIATRFKSANTSETAGETVQVVAFDPYDASRLGLSSLPSANPSSPGGIFTAGETVTDADFLLLLQMMAVGIAQDCTTTTITLDAGDTTDDTGYEHCQIKLVNGDTLARATAGCASYDSATKVWTFDAPIPDLGVGDIIYVVDSAIARLEQKVHSGSTIPTVTNVGTVAAVTTVNGLANNVVTANAIASSAFTEAKFADDAISARVVKDDAGTEIANAVWASGTRTLTAFAFTVSANDSSGVSTLLTRLTSTRAGYLDNLPNLDAAISTRSTYAGADTSGTTTLLARLTSTRAGYLDNISAAAPTAVQNAQAYAKLDLADVQDTAPKFSPATAAMSAINFAVDEDANTLTVRKTTGSSMWVFSLTVNADSEPIDSVGA